MTSFLPKWLNRAATFLDSTSGAGRFVFTIAASSFSGTVAIAESRVDPDLIAPASVFLQANVTDFGVTAGATEADYDPQFHDIEYIWSVTLDGDIGYATETYDKLVNLPTGHRAKGTKYGKRIAHIMERPGTYRFTVTAINLATGESATSSTSSYTVVSPDSYFSAAETFLVASDNDFTGAPASGTGTTQRYTTIAAADSAIEGASSLTKYRLLIKRGTTYDEGVPRPPRFASSNWTTVFVGAWGTGDNPVVGGVKFSDNNVKDSILSYRCTDIDVSKSLTGSNSDAFFSSHMDQGPTVTLWNMTSSCPTGIYGADNTSTNAFVAVGNCSFTDVFFTIAAFDAHGLGVIGSKFTRPVDGPSSLPAPDAARASYSIRLDPGGWGFVFSQIEHFNRMGWFDNVVSIQTTQPCFRLANTDAGARVTFDRCVIEGGNVVVRMDEGSTDLVRNVLMDRCMVLGNMDTRQLVTIRGRGATIRNSVFIQPGSIGPNNLERSSFVAPFGDGGLGAATPFKVYNNTFINLADTAPVGLPSSGDSGFVQSNNVLHEPYATTPVNTISFNLTEVFTPDYRGYWDTETSTGNITQDPVYLVQLTADATGFTLGETVRGQTSGNERVYAGTGTTTRGRPAMLFESTVTATNITTGRFQNGEVIEGLTSGATATIRSDEDGYDSGYYDTSLVPGTPTPTHVIAYDAQTGNFTEGETLTGGTSTATGTICQVYDDGTTGLIWLRDVTGTFADNETITDASTGSATANGTAVSAGTGALWVPASAIALESGTWAEKPFVRKGFTGQDITASQGAGLIDA